MRAHLIWNPAAGQHDVRRYLEEAMDTLEGAGWSVRMLETRNPGDGMRLARAAVAEGVQVAIAAGGDGTVNEVVNGLAGSSVALGVLPVGTGNVWAKELGFVGMLPTLRNPLREAATALTISATHDVDLGLANGRYFLLWAGLGFDAQVTHEVEPQHETRRRVGNLLYATESLRVALQFAGSHSTVTIDGRRHHQRVVELVIANAQLYSGGLVRVAPAACMVDGCLDVCIFQDRGPGSTLHHIIGLLARSHVHDPQVAFYRARRIEIEADRPMPVQIDGDAYGTTPLAVEVVPAALRVLVPPTAPASLFQRPQLACAP